MLCCAWVLQFCVWLFATPWTVAQETPLSTGILQARILEWVAMPSSRGSFQSRDWTQVSRIAGSCFTVWATSSLRSFNFQASIFPTVSHWFQSDRQQNLSDLKPKVTSYWFIVFFFFFLIYIVLQTLPYVTGPSAGKAGKASEVFYKLGSQKSEFKGTWDKSGSIFSNTENPKKLVLS